MNFANLKGNFDRYQYHDTKIWHLQKPFILFTDLCVIDSNLLSTGMEHVQMTQGGVKAYITDPH